MVETYAYTAFGQAALQTEVGAALSASWVGNRYRFTGREYDAESGLYYYRARMYNPAIGRFMQTDPVGYGDGLNWYAYCGNNPLMFVDPWGLCGQQSDWSDRAWRATAWTAGNGAQLIANAFQGVQDAAIGALNFATAVGYTAENGYTQGAEAYFAPSPQWARDRYWKQSVVTYEVEKIVTTTLVAWGVAKLAGATAPSASEGAVVKGQPRPSPNFQTPTNPPQLPPQNIPTGWRVRTMPSTEQYPNGYWRLEKPMPQGGWQGIDPSTMKPGTQPQTHVPLPPQ